MKMAQIMRSQTRNVWEDLISASRVGKGLEAMKLDGKKTQTNPRSPSPPTALRRDSSLFFDEDPSSEGSPLDQRRPTGSLFLSMLPPQPSVKGGGESEAMKEGEELVIEEGEVKGGTVEGLVYGLLDPKIPNGSFYSEVFFLTYRSFVSDSKFLCLLIKKYHDLLPVITPVDSSLSVEKKFQLIFESMNDLVSSPKSTPEQIETAIAQIDSWTGILSILIDESKTKDCCENCECFCGACTSTPRTCASCMFSCGCSQSTPIPFTTFKTISPSLSPDFNSFEAEKLVLEMKNEKKSLLKALSVLCETFGVGIRSTNRSKRMLLCNIVKKWYEVRQKEVFGKGGEGRLAEVFGDFVKTVTARDGEVVGRTLGALLLGGGFEEKKNARPFIPPFTSTLSSPVISSPARRKEKARSSTTIDQGDEPEVMFRSMADLRAAIRNPIPSSPLDFDVTKVAHQITLSDHRFLRDIPVFDMMNKKLMEGEAVGSGGDSLTSLPAVADWIKWFNDLNMVAATWILKETSAKRRTQALEWVISLLVKLRSLQNFQSVTAILGALRCSSVYRLKRTWAAISKTKKKQFDEITAEMSHSNNSGKYRALLEVCDPPLVPFLGTYLSDLTFIEDGNPDNLSCGYVNFTKRRLMGRVISELRSFQSCFYSFQQSSEIQDFLDSSERLDENEQYEESLGIEPRQKPQQKN